MGNPVDKSFEARVFAVLDQQEAEIKTVSMQLVGITAMMMLIGLGLWALSKQIGEAR